VADSIDQEVLAAFLDDANEVFEEWERFCLTLKPNDAPLNLSPLLRCAHNLKGSAGLTGLFELHTSLHRIEEYLVQMRDQKVVSTAELIATLLETETVLRTWVGQIIKNQSAVIDTGPLELRLHKLVASQQDQGTNDEAQAKVSDTDGAADEFKSEETLRVSVSKLDRLIQLVGEISLHQSILASASRTNNLSTPAVREIINLKSKLTQDLQDAALGLRMIPVDGLFQKIARMARETALRIGKQVEVVRKGDDVALDKLIVEAMFEPLIHVARNAVDHGIETIEERQLAGKTEVGTLHFIAENTSGGVTITITDDGRGIDAEKVYRKALEKKLISEDEHLTTEEKLQLVFIPGLSTAEKVTELSGRGVGMDVVADTVRSMAGQLEIQSQVGQGTQLVITLPTNLSIIDALIVRVAGSQYAIPNQDLDEVIDLRDFRVSPVDSGQLEAIDLRGRIVPVASMAEFLTTSGAVGFEPTKKDQGTPRPTLIVPFREEQIALSVDSVVGQQRIFVRPLIGHLAPISIYGGSTILSDGEPSIILNLPLIAQQFFTLHSGSRP